ncbi:hypothetical protein D3C80_1811920 [compost metagenome]
MEGVGGEEGAERGQFFVQTLAIAGQFALLVEQMLGRLLTRRFGVAQLQSQPCSILLQGEQGALALFVVGDALVQLAVLPCQPGIAFGGVLAQQLP